MSCLCLEICLHSVAVLLGDHHGSMEGLDCFALSHAACGGEVMQVSSAPRCSGSESLLS